MEGVEALDSSLEGLEHGTSEKVKYTGEFFFGESELKHPFTARQLVDGDLSVGSSRRFEDEGWRPVDSVRLSGMVALGEVCEGDSSGLVVMDIEDYIL